VERQASKMEIKFPAIIRTSAIEIGFKTNQKVVVRPNTQSAYKPDHTETPWTGTIELLFETTGKSGAISYSALVKPDSGAVPRTVSVHRLTPA
jgi:hypothetical protein